MLSCSIANTRPRDFYDIHILYSLRGTEFDPEILRQALARTAEKRGSHKTLKLYPDILAEIRASEQLRGFWKKYQRNFDYAKEISFMMSAIRSNLSWTALWDNGTPSSYSGGNLNETGTGIAKTESSEKTGIFLRWGSHSPVLQIMIYLSNSSELPSGYHLLGRIKQHPFS